MNAVVWLFWFATNLNDLSYLNRPRSPCLRCPLVGIYAFDCCILTSVFCAGNISLMWQHFCYNYWSQAFFVFFSFHYSHPMRLLDGMVFHYRNANNGDNRPYCVPGSQITWQRPSLRQLISSIYGETEMTNSVRWRNLHVYSVSHIYQV